MGIFKTLALTLLCALGLQLSGAPIPFRLGDILNAEISRNKVNINNLKTIDYDFKFKHYAYAILVFKLYKGRSISTYDFILKLNGKEYKCIAVRTGDQVFDTKKWQFTETSPDKIYSLLFIVDSETLGNAKKTMPATLIYTLSKSGKTNYEIPFKFINYTNLTETDKIPPNGVFPKVEVKNIKKSPNKAQK